MEIVISRVLMMVVSALILGWSCVNWKDDKEKAEFNDSAFNLMTIIVSFSLFLFSVALLMHI